MSFRLHLKNFQSIREATVDISPLTLLYGPNSAGKSTIADAIELLHGALGKSDALGLNDWRYRFFRKDADLSVIGVGVSDIPDDAWDEEGGISYKKYLWRIENKYEFHALKGRANSVDVTFSLVRKETTQLINLKTTIYIDGMVAAEYDGCSLLLHLACKPLADLIDGWDLYGLYLEDRGLDGYISWGEDTISIDGLACDVGEGWAINSFYFEDCPTWGVLAEVLSFLFNGLVNVALFSSGIFRSSGSSEFYARHAHLGPLRKIPGSEPYPEAGSESLRDGGLAWSVIARMLIEKRRAQLRSTLNIQEGSAHSGWSYQLELLNGLAMIDKYMNDDGIQLGYSLDAVISFDHVPVPEAIDTVPGPEEFVGQPMLASLRVVDRSTGRMSLLSDVGVGVSQLVPVIFAGVWSDSAIIEQPELHLHPKLQLELSSFFIEMVARGKSFVIETHSEHMILRVLRAIRESFSSDIQHRRLSISPDKVSVLYFEPVGDHTEIRRLRISEDGEFLDKWPQGFFAEREAELF